MFILKWTNKYSGETGYVASVSAKDKCFVNTFNKDEAKVYKSESVARRMITSLQTYGEAEQNTFEIVPA